MTSKVRNVSRGRKLTPEEAEKYKRLRAEIEKEKPAIVARLREEEPMAFLLAALHKARIEAGLSLADLGDRTGLDRSYLSRLETGERENPSLETLIRYAGALGKRVEVRLVDD